MLALDRAGSAPKIRGTSLLSVAADEEHDQHDVDDAATRHRLARFRCDAERAAVDDVSNADVDELPPSAQSTGDARPQARPAAAEPTRQKAPKSSSLMARWRSRLLGGSATATVSPPDIPDAPFELLDDRDDVRWKPLIDPMKVIGGIARSKVLIASTTLLGALLGVAIALSTPKMYQAWTEMIVDPRNLKLTTTDLTEGGLPSDATLAIVENQVRVLTSGTVLTKVVDKLNLADDPEFNGTAGGGFGVRSFIRSLLSGQDAAADDVARRHTLAATHLSETLTVERGGKTFVISIGAKTKDANKSALIANTMTDVFMQTYGEFQAGTAGRATNELNARLDELRKSVEAAERKVETFKAENELIDPQGRLITDDEIQRVNDQLTAARARTLELNARAASTRNVAVDSALNGALPEAINSPAITELRAQYAALTQEADRLSVKLGPRHPGRLAVEAQLSGARQRIAAELQRVAGSIQVELKRAVQMEQELAARLAQLKVRQGDVADELVTLRELERDVAAKRSVYEAFLLRARETGEQRDINSANVSVISVASPPLDATGPSRSMIALAGMFLGFASGVGIGALRGALESLRDTANRRARTRPQPRRAASDEPDADRDIPLERNVKAPAPVGELAAPSLDPQAGLDVPPQTYAASHEPAHSPAGPAFAHLRQPPVAQTEPAVPQNQIEEISQSLREVRKELNQLRERRSRRYF